MVSTTCRPVYHRWRSPADRRGFLNLVKPTDSDNKVHVGDKVVTSYISEKFLPGILIGYISELNNDSKQSDEVRLYHSVVDFRHLQEVLVILQRKKICSVGFHIIFSAGCFRCKCRRCFG